MNITFVSIHIEESPRAVPLGAAMLGSVLGQRFSGKVKCENIDLYLDNDVGFCIDKILASKARYIGFSMYLWNRNLILEIAKEINRQHPEIVIFLGGPEASTSSDSLTKLDFIDFVINGEGEEAICMIVAEILNGVDISSLPALLKNKITPDLNKLPSPFLDGSLNPDDYSGLLWELSRGCPFKCDFCFESRGTLGVRRFPYDRIKAELELFNKHGVNQIFVLDPTFNYNVKNAKKMLELMRDTAPQIHYFLEVRSEFIDEEIASLFASINCTLQIGLQSSHSRVLKHINRKLNREQFEQKILLLHQAGVVYGLDLIYGLPEDSFEGFCESIDFALYIAPNHLDVFALSVLPGTKLSETAQSFGLKYLPDNPYTVLETPNFDASSIRRAAKLAKATDIFYNQGRAVPLFLLIINSLEISPSDLLQEFSTWLDASNMELAETTKLQIKFLETLFNKDCDDPQVALLAVDIVSWFGYSANLIEEENDLPKGMQRDAKYILNPDLCFVKFNHNMIELLEYVYSGLDDIRELAGTIKPQKNESLLLFDNGEVEILSFTKLQNKTLKSLKLGLATLPDVDSELTEFLQKCIAANIILSI